jgi:hypothetical protein
MARYSAFLGRAVEVQYRAGDICLPASGTFVGDSGRSIFLEQHYEQGGHPKNFRWEIPYQCIVRLESTDTPERAASPDSILAASNSASPQNSLQASAAHASGGSTFLPVARRPKTA